jgi:signal transduction histidine kinase
MIELTRTRREIESAWRSFVVDGRVPASVKPEIVRSWERARAKWRVDPGLQTCPRARDADDLLARAAAEEAFRVASPLVTQFADRLAADGHVVAYFDADGVNLTVEGNHRTRGLLADVNFAPGACWAEDAAGTNGIGTALIEARPVEVFASEHFVEAWQPWTCASVPVRCRGQLLGVVDITSPWTAHNPTLLLCAESLARAIEAQLETAAVQRENAMFFRIAQQAVRAREEFLAVASHELRTPLTPLQLNIQRLQRLVRRAGTAIAPDQLANALRGADRYVRRLVEFIDDLVETSRVANHHLRLALEPTELGAIVQSVVERHQHELDLHGCDVAVTVASEVVGRWDPARIEQVVNNLVVNAVKYAPGRIEVVVDAEDDHALLSIHDEGPGIAPDDQERIFQPFERAVSYRHTSGFGLGLHVVREIVEAHGGAVHLESASGRGTTFLVELPLERDGATSAGHRLEAAGYDASFSKMS